ncbi:MAG: hypothetical protein EAZ97_00645 [Bacteroidetes bacterium]|nr:MAG: hypothetical protein EAZ97_00645 [Bacteroidota bacterium]
MEKNGFQLSKIRTELLRKLEDLRFVQNAESKDIVFYEPQNMKTILQKEEKVSTKQVAKKTKNRDKDSFQKQNKAKKDDKKYITLKEVRITNIPKKTQIWYLDTWDGQAIQNNKEKLIGLGVGNKLVDGILIFFDKDKIRLNVYFIELKSGTIDFNDIIEKVRHSISRFLLFLCLNETEKSKEIFINARVEFKTILFFNGMADKIDDSTDINTATNTEGLDTLKKVYAKMQTTKLTDARCYPTFETLLDNTPNPFKFIFRDKEEEISISFDELIRF